MTIIPAINTLDDVRHIVGGIPGPDEDAAAQARAREPLLTKPAGALGRLEQLTEWLSAWQGHHPPGIAETTAQVFAGTHGVTGRGVSAYPAEVTAQMVANFHAGGAAINQLCRLFDVKLGVHALRLDQPTRDFVDAPAMEESECIEAIAIGLNSVDDGSDLLCVGEMGIGNTTAAAALSHALYGGSAADWTGPGTGVDGDALDIKIKAVTEAVRFHRASASDPFELLRRLGGRELAAIAGALIGARLNRVPVLLDGFVCTAAAAVLEAYRPGALDHCQVGHVSPEPGHRLLIERLGKQPLLNLQMRLGEASGAVMAVAVVKAAVSCHVGMATFADARVADKARG
jgi:nicotinate-nucleotide--dimethylbenzimidazole phosphoribosyltransferase